MAKQTKIAERVLNITEVFTLEEILEENLGFKKVFRNDGSLSAYGEVAYEFLVQLLINLGHIGLYRPHELSRILSKLDMILNEPDVYFEED